VEHLQEHLRDHGIEGAIAVRLLSEKAEQGHEARRSRGLAFVDLESAQQLHKCLSLHHTLLDGRLINVEKSCGGRNPQTRAKKLAERRLEQSGKVREAIEQHWEEAKAQGLVRGSLEAVSPFFREKLFAFSPAIVQKVRGAASAAFISDTLQIIAGLEEALRDGLCECH
jgi:RNA recognition motif-containing protein